MLRAFLMSLLSLCITSAYADDTDDKAKLVKHLRDVYDGWRHSVINSDSVNWQRYTSSVRQINVRNRIWSERGRFPQDVFNLPAAPPSLKPLKILRARVKGPTAKVAYFGKVDFGVDGKPTENLFLISYVNEQRVWKYNGAEFINLNALPDVRKAIKANDLKFVDQADFLPTGVIEKAPHAIKGVAPYIAKTYVFCPGREVKLQVNTISRHLFQNTKRAEVVIGGAHLGENQMQYAIKDIPGGDPKAPMTIRIYLMSQIAGTQPLKVAEYQVEDGTKPKSSGTIRFKITKEMAAKLR